MQEEKNIKPSYCKLFATLMNCGYEKMFDQSRRVYDPSGLSPATHTFGGGNLEIKIVVSRCNNEQVPKQNNRNDK